MMDKVSRLSERVAISDKSHTTSERTAMHKNCIERHECTRQKQRLDAERRVFERQLNREETEIRHFLQSLEIDRAQSLGGVPDDVSDIEGDTDTDDCWDFMPLDDTTPGNARHTTQSPAVVVDPYPITFQNKLSVFPITDSDSKQKKLSRQRANEREPSALIHPPAPSRGTSKAKLSRQSSSSSLTVTLTDDSEVWVGDPIAISSVRRPQKSLPQHLSTHRTKYTSTRNDVTNMASSSSRSLTASPVVNRIQRPCSKSAKRPMSWYGTAVLTSEHGGLSSAMDHDMSANRRSSSDGYLPASGEHVGSEEKYNPRCLSSPTARAGSAKNLRSKIVRQRSLQEILLQRSICSYASHEKKHAPAQSSTQHSQNNISASFRVSKDYAQVRTQDLHESPFTADLTETVHHPKPGFKSFEKEIVRTRHGSLKDSAFKGISEGDEEGLIEKPEDKTAFRRVKSMKESSVKAKKTI